MLNLPPVNLSPLTLEEVVEALERQRAAAAERGVPPNDQADLIKSRGVRFFATEQVLELLRKAGASERLLEVIKGIAPPPKLGMGGWENPSGWVRDGNWFVHRGGNFVPFQTTPVHGTFVFTAALRRGRRLQWVLNRIDDRNYALFQMDKRFFYRNLVENGKATELAKIPHAGGRDYYTIEVVVSPSGVVHKLHDGEKWITLDQWYGWLGPARATDDFVSCKFGFLIPGNDAVALANFSFTPGQ